MKKLLFILAVSILMVGCSGYDGGDGDLESKLSRLEEGNSLFSFLFNGQQTGGLSVGSMIYTFESGNACRYLATEGEQEAGPSSFTMIKLDLNQAAAGRFEIVPSLNDDDGWADPGLLASVRFAEVNDWRSGFWVGAVSGSVDVVVAPETVPDWNAGVRLEGTLSVSFPVNFMRTTGCTTVGGPDYWQETCTCEDDEGNTSECENLSPGDDCCRWTSTEQITYQAEFMSAQCKEMCATAISGVASPIPYSCEDLD